MLFHSNSHSLTHVQTAIGASGTTGRARLFVSDRYYLSAISASVSVSQCVCRVCMLDDVRCSTERAVRSGVRIGSSSSAGKKRRRRRRRWRRRRQKQRRRRLPGLRFLLAHLRFRRESVAPAQKSVFTTRRGERCTLKNGCTYPSLSLGRRPVSFSWHTPFLCSDRSTSVAIAGGHCTFCTDTRSFGLPRHTNWAVFMSTNRNSIQHTSPQ